MQASGPHRAVASASLDQTEQLLLGLHHGEGRGGRGRRCRRCHCQPTAPCCRRPPPLLRCRISGVLPLCRPGRPHCHLHRAVGCCHRHHGCCKELRAAVKHLGAQAVEPTMLRADRRAQAGKNFSTPSGRDTSAACCPDSVYERCSCCSTLALLCRSLQHARKCSLGWPGAKSPEMADRKHSGIDCSDAEYEPCPKRPKSSQAETWPEETSDAAMWLEGELPCCQIMSMSLTAFRESEGPGAPARACALSSAS